MSRIWARCREPKLRKEEAGALCWIGTAQFFGLAHIVARHAVPQYSDTVQVLSDLGVRHCVILHSGNAFCSPWHRLFALTLLIQALCMSIGSWLLRATFARAWEWSIPALAGLSLVGVAAFPENEAFTVHLGAAAVHCIASNAAIVVLMRGSALRLKLSPGIRGVGYAAAVLGFCASAALIIPSPLLRQAGFIERLAVYPFPATLIVLGFVTLWRARKNAAFAIKGIGLRIARMTPPTYTAARYESYAWKKGE